MDLVYAFVVAIALDPQLVVDVVVVAVLVDTSVSYVVADLHQSLLAISAHYIWFSKRLLPLE